MLTVLNDPERLKRLVRLEYEQGIVSTELASRSLREFTRQAWHVVEPGITFMPNWHIDAISDHLEAVTRLEIMRLLINIPPRHAKSLSVSVFWPTWVWTFNPHFRWIFASYALSLAIADSLKCRRLLMSDWYQERFGHVFQLSKDNNLKSRFDNDKRGARLAVSTASAVTGFGGDGIVCDDPHNVVEAESQAMREATLDWWDTAMSSRLNNPKTGVKVIVMQRVHHKDLSGHVLEQGDYVHLSLPMEYEPDRKCMTVLGGKAWSDPRTEPGELLWKERFNVESIDNLKRSLGSYGYAGQYQQRPAPASGGMFKKQWLRYYSAHDTYFELETSTGTKRVERSACRIVATGDLAISEKQTADYTVFAIWAITPDKDILLLDVIRGRFDNPEQQKQIRLLFERYHPAYFLIEAVAYQLALVQQVRKQGIPVREYKPVKDKVSRAITASVLYEGEKVYHLMNASWLVDWETELLLFPKAANDDQVDNASMICEECGAPKKEAGLVMSKSKDKQPVIVAEQEDGVSWW